jgi:hypothetical protein
MSRLVGGQAANQLSNEANDGASLMSQVLKRHILIQAAMIVMMMTEADVGEEADEEADEKGVGWRFRHVQLSGTQQ